MTKYIFSIEKSQKLVSNNNQDLKRIKLKSLNGNREIGFCHTNSGTCSIYKDIQDQNKDKVLCWISDNTHHSCTSERMLKYDFDFNNTKARVVFDDNCEYRISLSDTSNGTHVILPRSLILDKNLNLKDYYNKEIKLIKGEKVSSATEDFECYTPKLHMKEGRFVN
ncbi:MAG: hypothetical protein ACR5K6_04750 [Wolbachia sp.]